MLTLSCKHAERLVVFGCPNNIPINGNQANISVCSLRHNHAIKWIGMQKLHWLKRSNVLISNGQLLA